MVVDGRGLVKPSTVILRGVEGRVQYSVLQRSRLNTAAAGSAAGYTTVQYIMKMLHATCDLINN